MEQLNKIIDDKIQLIADLCHKLVNNLNINVQSLNKNLADFLVGQTPVPFNKSPIINTNKRRIGEAIDSRAVENSKTGAADTSTGIREYFSSNSCNNEPKCSDETMDDENAIENNDNANHNHRINPQNVRHSLFIRGLVYGRDEDNIQVIEDTLAECHIDSVS